MLPNIKKMRKWMIEFLRKFENRGTKIARVKSILITKFINLPLFSLILYGVWGPLRSKAIFSAQSIHREVSGCGYIYVNISSILMWIYMSIYQVY